MKLSTAFFIIVTFLFCDNTLAQNAAEEILLAEEEDLKPTVPDKKTQDAFSRLKSELTFKNSDDNASLVLDGRIMSDFGTATKHQGKSGNTDTRLRRIWLGASGKISKDWNYRILGGFDNEDFRIADAMVIYRGFKNTHILAGNFFENNGLEISTINLIPTFMEFSSGIATFKYPRRVGISVNPHAEDWGLHFGFFGSSIHNPGTSAVNANNDGKGFSGRAHLALINDKKQNHYLHLGFNNSYRILENGNDSVTKSNKTMRFRSASDTNVIGLTLIDTKNITNVNSYYQNMAEFRYQINSLTITSEYLQTHINRSGFNDLNFSGGYVTASYFLTGEHYEYDAPSGLPGAPKINNHSFFDGAFEIGARYSDTNLNSKTVRGGRLQSYDLALNYYPNNNVRLMLNYILNRTDNTAVRSNNPQYLIGRIQVNF